MDKKNLKIMVVEDEDLLLQAISKKLGNMGMESISCSSAKQALDYLNELEEAKQMNYAAKQALNIKNQLPAKIKEETVHCKRTFRKNKEEVVEKEEVEKETDILKKLDN